MPDRCRTMVDGGGISSYRCDGDAGHDAQGEPCWSHEAPRSISRRDRWREEEQAKEAHQGSGLGQFQGRPQTTSERYTDDATPVPGGEVPITDYPGTVATRPQATPAFDRVSKAFREQGVVHEADEPTTPTPDFGLECEHDWQPAAMSWPSEPDDAPGTVTTWQCSKCQVVKDVEFREREGDQRLPVASGAPISHEEVRTDLLARLELGISRYGQPLQAHNGRNSFLDAYEEILDLSVYLKTLQIERAHYAERIRASLDHVVAGDPASREWYAILDEVATWLEQ